MQVPASAPSPTKQAFVGTLNYMPQLDGLRGLAVLGVLVEHYLPGEILYKALHSIYSGVSRFETVINNKLFIGHLGVRLFFVLSGFLITRNLLVDREALALNCSPYWPLIKKFYRRRLRRLMPVYYLVLLVTALLAFQSIKPALLFYFTYTSNIYFSFHDWDTTASHLWSLAVEEQFYLCWPWIILLAPERRLLGAMLLLLGSAFLFRGLCFLFGWSNGSMEYSMIIACLDNLCAGSLLALLRKKHLLADNQSLSRWFWLSFVAFACIHLVDFTRHSVLVVSENLVNSIFFALLINQAADGFGGISKTILEHPWLRYIGKISYGIYVYHYFVVPYTLFKIISFAGLSYLPALIITGLKFALSILVASLSWHLLEKQFHVRKVL